MVYTMSLDWSFLNRNPGDPVPVGYVTLFTGYEEDIPDDWAIADGRAGTIDLRNAPFYVDGEHICDGLPQPSDDGPRLFWIQRIA
jgi:hypothetical protein